jgi:TPR repeat protein
VVNDKGQGIRRNPSRAVRLYRQAALRGDLKSQTNLAVLLLDGDGVKKNTAEGLRWLRRAAQRGDDKAQYNLGHAYAYGEDGVRKNDSLALKWLFQSCQARTHQGTPAAEIGKKEGRVT